MNRSTLRNSPLLRFVTAPADGGSGGEPAYLMILDGHQLTTDLTTLSFVEDDRFREFFRKAKAFAADPGQLTLPRI